MGFSAVFGVDAAQYTLVTAALLPAVLGYALLLQCIVKIRVVEDRCNKGAMLIPRDLLRLGRNPAGLRYQYEGFGARVGQAMCLIFVGALICLATVSVDFMNGLFVIGLLGALLYGVMQMRIGQLVHSSGVCGPFDATQSAMHSSAKNETAMLWSSGSSRT